MNRLHRVGRSVRRVGEIDRHRRETSGAKPKIDMAQPNEALDHQPRAREQDQRQRNLRHDERAAKTAIPSRHCARRGGERIPDVVSRRPNRRDEPEHDAGRERDAQRERERRGVDADLVLPRNPTAGRERQQRPHAVHRYRGSRRARADPQQRALGHELSNEPSSARA